MIICGLQQLVWLLTHLRICVHFHTHTVHHLFTSVYSGGLAERLSRLQSRQRSAVSFWRHQSDASAATGEPRPPTFNPESGALIFNPERLLLIFDGEAFRKY